MEVGAAQVSHGVKVGPAQMSHGLKVGAAQVSHWVDVGQDIVCRCGGSTSESYGEGGVTHDSWGGVSERYK